MNAKGINEKSLYEKSQARRKKTLLFLAILTILLAAAAYLCLFPLQPLFLHRDPEAVENGWIGPIQGEWQPGVLVGVLGLGAASASVWLLFSLLSQIPLNTLAPWAGKIYQLKRARAFHILLPLFLMHLSCWDFVSGTSLFLLRHEEIPFFSAGLYFFLDGTAPWLFLLPAALNIGILFVKAGRLGKAVVQAATYLLVFPYAYLLLCDYYAQGWYAFSYLGGCLVIYGFLLQRSLRWRKIFALLDLTQVSKEKSVEEATIYVG